MTITSDGTLYKEYNYDKLKEFAKQMYLSPINYGDLYFELKGRLDLGE